MYRSVMLVFLGLWVCSSAFAAETQSSAVVMDEVVVTATRQVEELSTVPANVTVITETEISQWANTANMGLTEQVELTIRIVDKTESAELNEMYRSKNSATNVLAFPFEVDEKVELKILGDLVICAKIVDSFIGHVCFWYIFSKCV